MYDQDNPQADGILHDLHNQEYEMAKNISQHGIHTESYRTKLKKLKEMVNKRKELERMLHYKVKKNHYEYEKIKEERKHKDVYAKRIRRKLGPNPVPEKELNKQQKLKNNDKEYDPFKDGFYVQFDYILDIIEEFPQVQLVYGVYRRGVQVNEPKMVDIVFCENSNNPAYKTAFFDTKHSLRMLKPSPDTMLIIELQVPDNKNEYTENKMTTAGKDFGEISNMKTY